MICQSEHQKQQQQQQNFIKTLQQKKIDVGNLNTAKSRKNK